jgi:hypothetical protein
MIAALRRLTSDSEDNNPGGGGGGDGQIGTEAIRAHTSPQGHALDASPTRASGPRRSPGSTGEKDLTRGWPSGVAVGACCAVAVVRR